jgi:hypothetical protein
VTGALRVTWGLLLLVLLVLGCAGEDKPLWADPGVVRFAPDRSEVAIEIHNVSGTIRPIGDFELGGEDWDSWRFVDDSLPRTVPGNDSVIVRLAVSSGSFRTQPGVWHSGQASLRFSSNQHEFEVPLEFVGTANRRASGLPLGLTIVVLALLGFGIARTMPRPRWPSTAPLEPRLAIAVALTALLLLAATIPFGPGLCLGRAGAQVGPAELAQCRAGLGGHSLTLLPASPGVWWWMLALVMLAASMGYLRARASAGLATIGLSVVRMLGFAIVLASLALAIAPPGAEASDYVLEQLRYTELAGLHFPAWGLVALPIGCAGLVALTAPPSPSADPMLVVLERFERLVWAALLTTLFLGGWSIPGLSERPIPLLSHGAMLVAELSMFAVKVAWVDLALARLGQHLAVTPATLLRVHARWTVPILLLNLIAVAIWRAT